MKKRNLILTAATVSVIGMSVLLSGCAEGMIDPAMAMKAQVVQAAVTSPETGETAETPPETPEDNPEASSDKEGRIQSR